MIGQSLESTKFQVGEPMSFMIITYRNTDGGLLTGAEITVSQVQHQSPP